MFTMRKESLPLLTIVVGKMTTELLWSFHYVYGASVTIVSHTISFPPGSLRDQDRCGGGETTHLGTLSEPLRVNMRWIILHTRLT